MCQSFEKLADKVANQRADARETQTKINIIKSLLNNTDMTLDQLLTASGIQGTDRAIIAKQLKN